VNSERICLPLGTLVGGKYQLLEKIGEGGHGCVFQAVNTLLGRQVALKVLKAQFVGNEIEKKRFFREARTANLVRHPNVVDVLDVGDSELGPWMVQELLDGEPLSALLAREGALTVKRTIELLLPVLNALSVAHARGIAHRDFKPDNVFLARGEDGTITPKILDFGLSKSTFRFEEPRSSDRVTATGMLVGTPAYLAPERVRMENDGDIRGDVWSIGVVLYECTTGFLPFSARTVREMFMQIALGTATPIEDVLPDIDPSFATIVMRCLRKDPEQRYPSAAEIEEDIRRYLDGLRPEATLRRALVRLPSEPQELPAPHESESPPAEPATHNESQKAASTDALPSTGQPTPPSTAIAESASAPQAQRNSTPPTPAPWMHLTRSTNSTIEDVAPSRSERMRVLLALLAVLALAIVGALWRSRA
jgi:serine/threonine-protein kinase